MKYAVYSILILVLTSCGNSRSYTAQDEQAFQSLKEMVMAQNFEIQSNYARPMATAAFSQLANTNILGVGNTASNINITGNSNNLTVKGDSISGYFPYFGEIRFGGGYQANNHHGIEFKDIPEDYKINVNDDKHKVTISFSIDDQYRNNERYNVFITVFPNKRSTIEINSTTRTPIEFTGYATTKVDQEDEL